MNRIATTWESLARKSGKALIPYITPEYPFKGITVPLLRELEQRGADMIEVGIPFSDPLADGETIQRSSETALANGATVPVILDAVRNFRRKSELPVLLMGYINPIVRMGITPFVRRCVDAGVDGLIVPDLPPEEASSLRIAARGAGLSMVFLIAPTSSDERIRTIDDHSTDFSYCVSVTGVTGVRANLGSNGGWDEFLRRVRGFVRKKFVVGFGIATADQVRSVWSHADGAVVGSALIRAMSTASSSAAAVEAGGAFFSSLRPT